MIAVEWEHQYRNGTTEVRTGTMLGLLQGGKDQSSNWSSNDTYPCAVVVVRRDPRDPFVSGNTRPKGDFPNIMFTIPIKNLIVKGVHIPFEPHGAGK